MKSFDLDFMGPKKTLAFCFWFFHLDDFLTTFAKDLIKKPPVFISNIKSTHNFLIAWMVATLSELELLSFPLALQSTLLASRPLHRATALEISHLITGLFLIIYASHIPCHFYCVSHSTPTSFLFDFLFHFYH